MTAPDLAFHNPQPVIPGPKRGSARPQLPRARCLQSDPRRYTDALEVVSGASKDLFWVGRSSSRPARSLWALFKPPGAARAWGSWTLAQSNDRLVARPGTGLGDQIQAWIRFLVKGRPFQLGLLLWPVGVTRGPAAATGRREHDQPTHDSVAPPGSPRSRAGGSTPRAA
jgi:hypothetical protein